MKLDKGLLKEDIRWVAILMLLGAWLIYAYFWITKDSYEVARRPINGVESLVITSKKWAILVPPPVKLSQDEAHRLTSTSITYPSYKRHPLDFKYSTVVKAIEYQCAEKIGILRKQVFLNDNLELVYVDSEPKTVLEYKPGTPAFEEFKFVCDYKFKAKGELDSLFKGMTDEIGEDKKPLGLKLDVGMLPMIR